MEPRRCDIYGSGHPPRGYYDGVANKNTAPAAAVITLTLLALGLLVILLFAFGTNNTPASIDGDSATTSQDFAP